MGTAQQLMNNLSTTSPTITTVGAATVPNTAADPLYQYFHGVGFSPMLILFYTPAFLLSTIALFFNCVLLYVTVKTKSLHNSFNILIALDSFASAMFEVAYIFPFFIALFGINYIGAVPCFFLFLPHVIGGNTAPTFMFYVGLERLCCLVFPIWTKNMSASSSKALLFVGFVLSNTYWIYYAVILYQATVNEMWNMEVRCSMGDIMPDRIRALFFRNGLAILGATTTLYSILCIAVLIRAMWSKTQITAYNWHILKAVSVIMALLLTGWVLNASSIYYLPPFNLNAVQRLVASSILNDWTLLCSGSNGPVLYMFSVDYRRAFKKELKCFFSDQSPSSNNNNMGSIPPVSRINPHRRMIQIQSPNL